jgi:putative transposase
MSTRRRHSKTEVSALLQQANALLAQGKRQKDVAGALGISVMTFHRWRKAQGGTATRTSAQVAQTRDLSPEQDLRDKIADMQLENTRLRRLVTDLLLEKMKLQEALEPRNAALESTGRVPH